MEPEPILTKSELFRYKQQNNNNYHPAAGMSLLSVLQPANSLPQDPLRVEMPDHNHKHGAHVPHLHAPHLKDLVVSKAKARVLERSIAAAGRSLLATLTGDPYMPGSIRDGVANTFKTTVWPQVTEFLLDTLSDQTRARPNLHREWPADCLTAAEGSRWERFRCVVLYAIFPADLSFWAKLRCPPLLSIYLLLLFPYYGVSLLMMLLLLLCIDWRCEYSLINYIVLIRALSFITVGLSWTSMVVPHAYTLCTTPFTLTFRVKPVPLAGVHQI